MAAVGIEEDLTVQAARILLTLRKRKLLRWPEWVQKEPATAAVYVGWNLERCPKRPRSGARLRGDRSAAKVELVASSIPVEEAPMASAAATAVEPLKEPMTASSPKTPLDFTAAGSVPSSSGDDAARPPPTRGPAEALGSGGSAASSDEGRSTPDKQAWVAAGDKAISVEPNMETPDDGKKAVKFEFDLNLPLEEDKECPPGFC